MNGFELGCVSREELLALAHSETGALVTAAMTREPRRVAAGPSYFSCSLGSVNVRDGGNLGYKEYAALLPELKRFGKPIVATIGGRDSDELLDIVGFLSARDVDMIQLDLSQTDSAKGRVIGYSFRNLEPMIEEARRLTKCSLGIVMPLCLDPVNVTTYARLALSTGLDFIVAVSPVMIGMFVDTREQRAVVKGSGLGRLTGPAVKPPALANVRILFENLQRQVPVIGAGGIRTAEDVLDYLLAGATAVQVGTVVADRGPAVLGTLRSDLTDLLKSLGIATARDAVGALKLLD